MCFKGSASFVVGSLYCPKITVALTVCETGSKMSLVSPAPIYLVAAILNNCH